MPATFCPRCGQRLDPHGNHPVPYVYPVPVTPFAPPYYVGDPISPNLVVTC